MSKNIPPPYIIHELPDISQIVNLPISNTQRIKYTCFDVSRTLIVFGATSGGIYIFKRCPCVFVQLIPNKDGAITEIKISPNEKYISYANHKGIVSVVECNVQTTQTLWCSVQTSKEHQGNTVTAIVWNEGTTALYIGDDAGKVSVLLLSTFMTKTMFSLHTCVIMTLDSRIYQLDMKFDILLVSTLTRCYICDTTREQYRQVGQQLRDGEFGSCFLSCSDSNENRTSSEAAVLNNGEQCAAKVYNAIESNENFSDFEMFSNVKVYSSRPSSRIWEAEVDGTVKRTHQFKQILAKPPSQVITNEQYNNEQIMKENLQDDCEMQSVNFTKLLRLKNEFILTFKENAIYLLNPEQIESTIWCDYYKDIISCKVSSSLIYLWLSTGKFVILSFIKLEKFLLSCFLDNKYILCAKLCGLHLEYLLETPETSKKMYVLSSLIDKLDAKEHGSIINEIKPLIDELSKVETQNSSQLKSGIFIVGNTYYNQTSLLSDEEDSNESTYNLDSEKNNKFSIKTLNPEALQALKDLSISVSDKLTSGTKKLKEKWDDLEDKMKNIGNENNRIEPFDIAIPGRQPEPENQPQMEKTIAENIVSEREESSQNNETKFILDRENIIKSLYQNFRLSLIDETKASDEIVHILDENANDLIQVHTMIKELEGYLHSIKLNDDDSSYVSRNIFLIYINKSDKYENVLDCIVVNETLCTYFIEACIYVNLHHKIVTSGCECGYPLPDTVQSCHMPLYSKLIDGYMEKQWFSNSEKLCYDVCKEMPYMWRKILYLRRNEDMRNVLLIILQMLDEELLYSFLPQFTLDTWDRAVQLYATLRTNVCLNCGKQFENISVKKILSWDRIGAMMIKSVGAENAVDILEKHSVTLTMEGLSMKFHHTCLLVRLFEKYDATVKVKLADTVYDAYEYEEARIEICKLLQKSVTGEIAFTALPLIVATKSTHWGILGNSNLQYHNTITTTDNSKSQNDVITEENNRKSVANLNFEQVLQNIDVVLKSNTQCNLCGLPLVNEVLVRDGGLWVFSCGDTFHGSCLDLAKVKLCPMCSPKIGEQLELLKRCEGSESLI